MTIVQSFWRGIMMDVLADYGKDVDTVGNIWIGEVLENGGSQGLKVTGINGLTGGQ